MRIIRAGAKHIAEQNQHPSSSQLERELDKLSENLSNLFKSLWDSEERKSIEREITAGVESANKALEDAAQRMRTDRTAESLKQGAKDAWENARGPQIMTEVQTGLTNSLRKLNQEMGKRAAPAQEVKPDAPASDTVMDATMQKPD